MNNLVLDILVFLTFPHLFWLDDESRKMYLAV